MGFSDLTPEDIFDSVSAGNARVRRSGPARERDAGSGRKNGEAA